MISDADLELIRRGAEYCARDERLANLAALLESIVRVGDLLADGQPVDRFAAVAVVDRATRVSRSLIRSRVEPKDP